MNANRIFTRDEIANLIRQPAFLTESVDDGAMVLKASLVVFGPNIIDAAAELDRRFVGTIRLPGAVRAG